MLSLCCGKSLTKLLMVLLIYFLLQTNPSPSEETNHTDSLSTSYDTSADLQSLNATTPGQGGLHDIHRSLHVRNNAHKGCIYTFTQVLLSFR